MLPHDQPGFSASEMFAVGPLLLSISMDRRIPFVAEASLFLFVASCDHGYFTSNLFIPEHSLHRPRSNQSITMR